MRFAITDVFGSRSGRKKNAEAVVAMAAPLDLDLHAITEQLQADASRHSPSRSISCSRICSCRSADALRGCHLIADALVARGITRKSLRGAPEHARKPGSRRIGRLGSAVNASARRGATLMKRFFS